MEDIVLSYVLASTILSSNGRCCSLEDQLRVQEDGVIVYGKDLGRGREEMLPREWLYKRRESPKLLNRPRKHSP